MVRIQHEGMARERRTKQRDDILIAPFTVIYDNREERGGWRFQGIRGTSDQHYRPILTPLVKAHLKTADYTIEGSNCFIERKSHDDCIGSIGGGHDNLRHEHERMAEIVNSGGFCCVIVESSLDAVIADLEQGISGRSVSPETVLGVMASWQIRYRVWWSFAGSRELAERLAFKTLWKWWEQYGQG